MSTSAIQAQEPVIVKATYKGERFEVSKELASDVFIYRKAKIAIPNRTDGNNAYAMSLDEESAQKVGLPVIYIFFVNNAKIVHPYIHNKGDTLTLEVYPFRDGIFYCKNYMPQKISDIKAKQMYDNAENDIINFLEHAVQGDTLREPENLVDSRYTPLLIKNLSNDSEVYIEQFLHGDGVRYKKFLGIVYKKEKVGFSEIIYTNIRMSDFARDRLEEIFHPIYWSFDFPDANASAEEWQTWLDALLNTEPIIPDSPSLIAN